MKSISHNLPTLFADADCQVTRTAQGWQLHCSPEPTEALYANVSEHWVILQAPLAQIVESDLARRANFYRSLLELNERQLYLAKFALDDGDHLLLTAEAPLTANSRQMNASLVKSLARYVAAYAGPVRSGALICDPKSVRVQPMAYTPFDDFLLSPESVLSEYVWGVSTEGWWPLDKQPRGQSWRMGYKGHLKLFDQAFLKLNNAWVLFEVRVLEEPVPGALFANTALRTSFLRYLLRLNDELFLAKFGLDEEGKLVLLLELPLAVLDFDLFLMALRTLSHYLDNYAQELEILAWPDRNPQLAALVAPAAAPPIPFNQSRTEV